MKIIVCGAGKVGDAIARQLILEENDVTVIDQSEELIEEINTNLDVKAIVGFASHPTTLEEAGAYDADMIIAVTKSDEINMVACQVSHSVFNIPKKIARIRNRNYFIEDHKLLFSNDNMPINAIISPEIEVAEAILDKLHVPGAIESIIFSEKKIRLISLKLFKNSILEGLTIYDANQLLTHLNARIICFSQNDKTYTKHSKASLSLNDEVYVLVSVKDLKEVMQIFSHSDTEAKKIHILGGGRIGQYIALNLEKENVSKLRIIERNTKKANYIAELLEDTPVINGDGLDQDILEEINISTSDTVIAVTNDDEANILFSLLAKKLGCKKAITLVNNISFSPLFSSLGIDAIVNPSEITISSILKYIKNINVRTIHSICHSKAEIIEADIDLKSKLLNKKISELNLPKEIQISLVIRGEDDLIFPENDKEIILQNKDRLLIFSFVEQIKKIEQIFS